MAPLQNVEVEKMVKFGLFVAPQGRHDQPILVKFGMEEWAVGLLSQFHSKFGPDG